MEKLHITPENIARWLEQLIGSGRSVYAPVRTGERVDFKKIARPEEVASDYVQTTQSVKKVVFPRTEELFSYRKEGKQVSVRQPDLQAIPETVVWKIRPCDAAGFASLSGIFNWDYKDGSYNARAERLTLISFSCATSDEYCFCTSVGGGPGSTTGSDIQLTLLPDGGALVEVLTPKGERLAAEASSLFASADGMSKEEYLARVEKRFDAQQLREKLDQAFDSPVWKRQSERCLGCGACAFVCPTCACFDIQEDARGRPAGGCAAGIRAASRFSRCIRRDITRVRCKAPAGASEYCINSRTCPNGSDRPAVPVADAARGPAQ